MSEIKITKVILNEKEINKTNESLVGTILINELSFFCFPSMHEVSINGEKSTIMDGPRIRKLLLEHNLPLGHFEKYTDEYMIKRGLFFPLRPDSPKPINPTFFDNMDF